MTYQRKEVRRQPSVPYSAPFVTALLRKMPDAEVLSVTPRTFQMHPAAVIERAELLRGLIANERARRAS